MHVSESSVIPDHCRRFALSDAKCRDYQETCSHTHDGVCDRCILVELGNREIDDALKLVAATSEESDELMFTTEQAKRNINAWKAHLLRSVNQDEARVNVIDGLDDSSVFLVQDWAMKFLPRKYRESQSDWFAKRGLPWHISVAVRQRSDQQLESMTFVHIFQACSQDSNTVLAIMADVLTKLKNGMPSLESVFYRSDNAGCYHCASTIVGAKVLGNKAGVALKRMDFSDPQGGKGACDRKAATIKSHMQIYLNAGNDIETAVQMKAAIESSGGVPGVVVTLADTPEPQTKKAVTWEGVSFINNIQYESDCLRVWKSYNIGPGKIVPWSKFDAPAAVLQETSSLVDLGNERSTELPFVGLKPRNVAFLAEATSSGDDDGSANEDDVGSSSALFSCPEEGCVMTYQRYSSLEQHVECGKHKRALEQETLLDRAMVKYAYELEKGGSKVAELCDMAYLSTKASCDVQIPPLSMGWALKSSLTRKTRFNSIQKDYLRKKFDIGQKTGRKLDPVTVSQEMRSSKDSSGNRLFSRSEFLTGQQVQSFFSRLASKRSVDIVTEEDEEEEICARHEEALSEMRNDVSSLVALHHPITYDTFNICELASRGKLASTFSVSVLRDICLSLDIDVSCVTVRLKKPYIDKLQELVKSCSCSK